MWRPTGCEPSDQKMTRLTATLSDHYAESVWLESANRLNLASLGHPRKNPVWTGFRAWNL